MPSMLSGVSYWAEPEYVPFVKPDVLPAGFVDVGTDAEEPLPLPALPEAVCVVAFVPDGAVAAAVLFPVPVAKAIVWSVTPDCEAFAGPP